MITHTTIIISKIGLDYHSRQSPPIVSNEDFAAVQEILSRYKSSTTAKPVNNPLLDDVSRPRRERMISGEQMANNPISAFD